MKILWTETALSQLEEVPRGPAEQTLARLDTASRHPEIYPVRQRGRHRGIRWFPAGPWLVFYEVAAEALVVRGILFRMLLPSPSPSPSPNKERGS